jgi:hypothetical protein
MAIRLRVVGGVHVALCAYETDPMEGDIYIGDEWHVPLAAKFRRDWYGQTNDFPYPEEWAAMDTQKLRDAATRDDLNPTKPADEREGV